MMAMTTSSSINVNALRDFIGMSFAIRVKSKGKLGAGRRFEKCAPASQASLAADQGGPERERILLARAGTYSGGTETMRQDPEEEAWGVTG